MGYFHGYFISVHLSASVGSWNRCEGVKSRFLKLLGRGSSKSFAVFVMPFVTEIE